MESQQATPEELNMEAAVQELFSKWSEEDKAEAKLLGIDVSHLVEATIKINDIFNSKPPESFQEEHKMVMDLFTKEEAVYLAVIRGSELFQTRQELVQLKTIIKAAAENVKPKSGLILPGDM